MKRPQVTTRAEKDLHEAVARGDSFAVSVPGRNDPSTGATWGDERRVGAHHLVWLCRNLEAGRTVAVSGVRISGTFDISYVRKRQISVEIENCYFDDEVIARGADLEWLRLDNSHLPGFDGRNVHTARDLSLACTHIRGSCLLEGGRVEGVLSLRTAKLSNGGAVALDATGLHVRGRLDGFGCQVEGSVLLPRAVVEAGVVLDAVRVADVQGHALDATYLRVDRGGLSLCDHIDIGGLVLLAGAEIVGDVRIRGTIKGDSAAAAVQAPGLVVGGSLVLDQGTQLDGALLLRDAKIDAAFRVVGTSIHSTTGPGVDAGGVRVGEVTVDSGSTVDGGANLSSAIVAGSVEIGGRWSSFRQGGDALDATGATLQTGSFTLLDGAVFTGRVSLAKASVPEAVDIRDVVLTNPGGTALDLSASTTSDRTRTGELRVAVKRTVEGAVVLRNALVTRLVDEPATWHRTSQLDLRDFDFAELAEADKWPARDRLRWLMRGNSVSMSVSPPPNRVARWLKGWPPTANPKPYESLERAYRASGHDREARQVRSAKWRQINRSRSMPRRCGAWILKLAVGTSWVPWPAVVWLGLLGAGGGLYFAARPPLALSDPSKPETWYPWLYTLDRMVPTDLGWEKPFKTVEVLDHVVSLVLMGGASFLLLAVFGWLAYLATRHTKARTGS